MKKLLCITILFVINTLNASEGRRCRNYTYGSLMRAPTFERPKTITLHDEHWNVDDDSWKGHNEDSPKHKKHRTISLSRPSFFVGESPLVRHSLTLTRDFERHPANQMHKRSKSGSGGVATTRGHRDSDSDDEDDKYVQREPSKSLTGLGKIVLGGAILGLAFLYKYVWSGSKRTTVR